MKAMRKLFRRWAAGMTAVLMLPAVAWTGCSDKEEPEPKPEVTKWQIEATAKFAVKSEAAGDYAWPLMQSFAPTDRIYIWNKTRRKILNGCLKAEAAGDAQAKLVVDGELTGNVEGNDQLLFYYVPENWNAEEYIDLVVSKLGHWYLRPTPGIDKFEAYDPKQTGRPGDEIHYAYYIGSAKVWNTTEGLIRLMREEVVLEPEQSMFSFKMAFYDKNDNQIDVSELGLRPSLTAYINNGGSSATVSPYSFGDNIVMAMNVSKDERNNNKIILGVKDKDGRNYSGDIVAEDKPFENGMYYTIKEPVKMKKL